MRLRALALVALLVPAACTSTRTASDHGVAVVAAEDMWGSVARQLGGTKVAVTSLIANPDTDPHDYEPTASDGRRMATARVAVVNGLGYDAWADKLLAANAASGRVVVRVGDVMHLHAGANPHQWYSPSAVAAVADVLTAAYRKADPKDASYFDQQRAAFETALATYHSLIDDIRSKYAGVPVGATESIFAPLADALGLKVLTPPAFLEAIAEGTDPTAVDKATFDGQIASHAIKVLVFNSQNATPDVQRLVDAARRAGIPVATVTETLTPKGATFQEWQVAQLRALQAALAKAGT